MNPQDRLKNAYLLNNIPWDVTLGNLPDRVCLETAEYWEDKAANPRWAEELVAETIKRAGLGGPTGSGTAVRKAEAQYHGSRR